MDQWESFGQFLAMGGYAGYVWPCVVLTLVVLLGNVLLARRRHAAALRTALRRLEMDRNGETP